MSNPVVTALALALVLGFVGCAAFARAPEAPGSSLTRPY